MAKVEDGKILICAWPDGTWCLKEDIEEYTHMSDDYFIVSVPEECDDEEIEEIVTNINKF